MAISFTLPEQVEKSLCAAWGDVNEAAKEALLIESYRAGKIGLGEIAQSVGLQTRIEAQQWLAARQIPLNYDTEDLEQDRSTLGRLFKVKL